MFSEMFFCCFWCYIYVRRPSQISAADFAPNMQIAQNPDWIFDRREIVFIILQSRLICFDNLRIYISHLIKNARMAMSHSTIYAIRHNTIQYDAIPYNIRSVLLFAYRCTSKYQILRNRTCHIKLTYIQGKHFQIDFFLIYISMIKVWRLCSVSISR